MDGNDISLGALRIANPDEDSHSPSPPPPALPADIATVTISADRPPQTSRSSDNNLTARPRATSAAHDPTSPPPSDFPTEAFENPSITGTTLRHSPTQKAHNIINNSRFSQGPSSLPMPMGHQAQQQTQFPSAIQPRSYPPPGVGAVRPISGMYNHANASTGSAAAPNTSYRYNDNPGPAPQPHNAAISRSASTRKSAAAMQQAQAGVASRDSSYTDRSYLNAQATYGGNGPAPPRRSSRRVSPGSSNVGGASSMASAAAAAALAGGSAPSASGLSASPYGRENGPLASTDEWQERGAAVGVQREVDANGNVIQRTMKKGVKDFDFGRTLGEGSYSTVLAATDRQSGREYAIKVLDKRHIIKEKKVKYVNIEKDTLNRLTDHPGVVRLYYTFQDERSLYFVLDLASGGELLGVLKKYGTFDVDCTQFYAAQILDTIEYMHKKGVIHRDLKPENVLLDSNMHVKITDFGTAKLLDNPQSNGSVLDGANTDRANSFVGTAEYVSPELLTDKNACKSSDLWAFGCIIYQLIAGRPPFKASNEYLTFQKIVALEYTFPEGFPEIAKDLVERLLVLDPMKRLPIEHIKNHHFFDGVAWGKGLWKQKAPKLKPYVPPSQQPIRLNGPNGSSAATSSGQHRPQPRVFTELPPPSQLDIEWSPVLIRNNERILKLGNLLVTSAPPPTSPTGKAGEPLKAEPASGFRKFFGASNLKKRQRLVMITSSAHLVMAAAGGDEKKAKTDINLLSQGCAWRTYQDTKGLTVWCLDTRDKHFIFEDPKATTSDPDGSKYSTAEWLESIESAKDFALSQSLTNSYSNDSGLLSSAISSPASTLNIEDQLEGVNVPMTQRHLRRKGGRPDKQQGEEDAESVRSLKGRKRFSRRHSKNGLAAVF